MAKLRKQVAMFTRSGLRIPVQLSNLAGHQRALLRIKRSDIALSMPYLPRDPQKLRRRTFPGNRSVDLPMIVQQTLQHLGIPAAISLIGPSHQQRKVPLLVIIPRKVRMYALGNIAKKRLEAGRRVELLSLPRLTERSIMGLLRLPPSLLGPPPRRVGVIQIDLPLRNARLQVIELSIENAHLPKITPLKSLKLRPNLGKLRLALRQRRANGSKLLPLIKQGSVVRSLLEDDLGWHVQATSSLAALDTPAKMKTRKECESGHRAGLLTLRQNTEVRT